MAAPRWLHIVRPQDLVWLLLFSAMAAVSGEWHTPEIVFLSLLAILQVAEPRIPFLATAKGNLLSIFLKLALGYFLVGFTGGLTSSYYLILLLPVVSAATTLGGLGTACVTALAGASYVSFWLFIDWTLYSIPAEGWRELSLRVTFLVVVGYLTHQMAEENRAHARRAEAAASQLAEANRNLREAEAAVRRSERLAALGQLTAGLAHELRNPLGTIRASAEMLQKGVAGENEVSREVAGFIASEVDRTNSLVTRFLDFARPLHLRLKDAELTEVIDRAVDQLERNGSAATVSVFRNYSPDVRPFPFDAELMERVIYNLLANAVQASSPGGAVTVKTRPVDGFVEIAVIDRGSGIDPAQLENIFNPFFTTKPEGVGLGLAIVSKIVDEHGGRITVESEVGRGSVFRVYLPVRAGAPAPAQTE